MRQLLNTLFITTTDAYLHKDGQNIVMTVNEKETFRIPAINIESIVTFSYMGVSPGLMKLCADNNISITFLSPNGRFISRIQPPTRGNVLLRKQQYALADNPDKTLHLARLAIAAKIQNYRSTLQRFLRDYGNNLPVANAASSLLHYKQHALRANDTDTLRGTEGMAANTYFGIFPHLIVQQANDFSFTTRTRRPPRDPINAMLSFAYTLATNDITAALETVGLDPYVGYLHTLRPGRASLSLDMVEEFRASLGDRFVLSLINRRQITPKDFITQTDSSVMLTDNGRRTFLTAWQKRKKETIIHPFLNEKMEIGLLPHAQAMLLARYIRGDIDDYPVYLIK